MIASILLLYAAGTVAAAAIDRAACGPQRRWSTSILLGVTWPAWPVIAPVRTAMRRVWWWR